MLLSEKTDAGETLPTTRCKDKIMITGASSLTANTVQLLFGTSNAANKTETDKPGPGTATVQPENVSRAGSAIGKIIEIVAGMNQSDNLSATDAAKRVVAPGGQGNPTATGKAVSDAQSGEAGAKSDDGLFTMEGAKRIDRLYGGYMLVKTGTGKVVSDEQYYENGLNSARRLAADIGPRAEKARAYLDAVENGTLEITDLTTKGVVHATETRTLYYYADGTQSGVRGSWSVTGLHEFREANMFIDDDGISRDKATGKYASTGQNGTHFIYFVWG